MLRSGHLRAEDLPPPALPSGPDLPSANLLPRFDLRAEVLRPGHLLRGEALRSGHLLCAEVLCTGHLRAADLLPQAPPPSPPPLPDLRAEDLLPVGLRAGVLCSGRLPLWSKDHPGRSAGPAEPKKA